MPVAILLTRCEDQLRQQDKELRWSCRDLVSGLLRSHDDNGFPAISTS